MKELDNALKNLKVETIDKVADWFWKLKYARFIYIILYLTSGAYVLTSFYLTFKQP